MRQLYIYAAFTLSLIIIIGCHRKELENIEYAIASIPITTDWSQSLVDVDEMSNITIMIFPESGGEPTTIISNNHTFNVVQLPIGVYSVLIHNEMGSDLDGVAFSNTDSFDDISVSITQKSEQPTFHTVADDEHLTTHHEHIAAWHLSELVVNKDMVEYTLTDEFKQYLTIARTRSAAENRLSLSSSDNTQLTRSLDSLSSTTPSPVTTIMNITVGVDNLNSAASIEAILSGTTSGSTLISRSTTATTDDTNIYDFFFTNWVYDETTDDETSVDDDDDDDDTLTDGKIYYTLNTFVLEDDSDESYQLKFSVLLQTGEMETYYRDITEQIEPDDDHEVDIDLTIGDDRLTLPESESAGFNVNGWGDAVHVTL